MSTEFNEYEFGEVVRVFDTVTVSGAPADPSTITLTIRKPDGTIATPATTHDGLGLFHADVATDQAGTWRYRFSGTGAAAGAGEKAFRVRASRVLDG